MATTNPHGTTDRQFAFCRFYVEQGLTNASAAYRKAYPNCKSEVAAESCSSRLLRNAKVMAYLDEVRRVATERTQITADRVLEELGRIGLANMDDYAEWGPAGVTLKSSEDMTSEMKAVVGEVSETITKDGGTIRFKLHDKLAALDKIGRHFKLFTDTMEHTVKHELDLSKLSDAELKKLEAVIAKATK